MSCAFMMPRAHLPIRGIIHYMHRRRPSLMKAWVCFHHSNLSHPLLPMQSAECFPHQRHGPAAGCHGAPPRPPATCRLRLGSSVRLRSGQGACAGQGAAQADPGAARGAKGRGGGRGSGGGGDRRAAGGVDARRFARPCSMAGGPATEGR